MEKIDNVKEQLQEKYVELQMTAARIKQIKKQLKAIESQEAEMEASFNNIEELAHAESEKELLVPVGQGIYMRVKSAGAKDFLVSVGAGVVLEKSVEQTKALLREQLDELLGLKDQIASELPELMDAAKKLETELEELSAKVG